TKSTRCRGLKDPPPSSLCQAAEGERSKPLLAAFGTNLDQNPIAPALYGRAWIVVVWQRCCWRRFKQPFTLIGLRKRRIDRHVALHHQKVGTEKNRVK